MAELIIDDVRLFAGGRLDDVDDEVLQALLDGALAAARRYCGWRVSPVIADDELVVDGPGGRVLSLPTLKLNTLTSVSEDGVALDVSTLQISKRLGLVEKPWPRCWTYKFSAITVKMTHGFTEVEAADWRHGVLRLVDLMGKDADNGRVSGDMIVKRVDDIQYHWAPGIISDNDRLSALFSSYLILPAP